MSIMMRILPDVSLSLDSSDSGSVVTNNQIYVFAFDENKLAGFQPQ
jgi:hypothetical protein